MPRPVCRRGGDEGRPLAHAALELGPHLLDRRRGERSHFERTISVEQCALPGELGGGDVTLDDPLARRRSARARRRPARPPGARAARSSTRCPGGCVRLRRKPGRVDRAGRLRPSRSSTVSIASRVVPGQLGDDRPLVADQRVEERRLADVRAPEDRDADRLVADLAARARRCRSSRATISSSRSPVPWPCIPESGDRVAEPEAVELERARLPARGRRSCSRARARACATSRRIVGELLVAGRDAGARVDDEQDEVGLGDGARAPARRSSWTIASLARDVDPARVDRAGSACRPTRRRAPCGRASCRSSRARRRRGSR